MHPFLVKRPIGVLTVLAAVLALGLSAMRELPVSLLPDVDLPQITVQISYPTASARQLHETVAEPLRLQLLQMSSPVGIRTDVRDGTGSIVMTADYGTDMDFLLIEVNEKIDRAMDMLPVGVARPKVIRNSVSDIPAFYLNISGKTGGAAKDFMQVSHCVRQYAARRVEQLAEVAMVDCSGLCFPEIRITPKNDRMMQAGLQLNDIEEAVRSADLTLGSLQLKDGGLQYNIRFDDRLLNAEDIGNIVLQAGERLVRLRDVAEVIETVRTSNGSVLSDGRRAVSMAVIKRRDARMHDLNASIHRLVDAFGKDYPEMEFTLTRNQTALLEEALRSMMDNLILGTLLACLVVFLFMDGMRAPLLVSATIPMSLVIALLVFRLTGIGINIVSLSGLILGIGMLVDNAIITMDNINRWQGMGTDMEKACVCGTREVFTPILSSVMTTCAIFIPLVFMNGLSGALFHDQAVAVTVTMSAALAVSMIVLPVCCAVQFRHGKSGLFSRRKAPVRQERMQAAYHATLKWCLRHRRQLWHVLWISAAGSLYLFLTMEKQKMPDIAVRDTLMEIAWNENISAGENERRCAELLKVIPEGLVRQSTVMAGIQQFILSHSSIDAVSDALIHLACDTPEAVTKAVTSCRDAVRRRYPAAVFSAKPSGNVFDQLFADNEPLLMLQVRRLDGEEPSPAELEVFRNRLAAAIPGMHIQQVEKEAYIELSGNRNMMDLYGVGHTELASGVRRWFRENHILEIAQGNWSMPVTTLPYEGTDTPPLQEATLLEGSAEIPLAFLLRESRKTDLKHLSADNHGAYCGLSIEAERKDVPNIIKEIKQLSEEGQIYQADFTGAWFTGQRTAREFLNMLFIAVLLLYLILAAQFESLLQPFIILTELIIDIFFALATLRLCGGTLNVMSMTGLVVMTGIVINDSILKIDTINHLRKNGMALKRALFAAGSQRLNAIIMTSLTTILTLVPFLFRHTMGNDLQRPLSITLISGMCTGTLVSLFFVPMLYYVIYQPKSHAT